MRQLIRPFEPGAVSISKEVVDEIMDVHLPIQKMFGRRFNKPAS